MIAELGHFAVILALSMALAQAIVPLWGAHRNDAALMALSRPAAQGQALFLAVAFACLTYAYVTSDFSLANVYQNSHSAKPMLYKVSGVWGNHEGSMLMWVLILSVFGAAVATFGGNLPPGLRARALSVQAMISIAFLAFILFTSNPFERLDPAPIDGRDLNPLLQDPGLAFHPPMLYLGYVGFSMAFSFAVAALLEGRVDAAWARWVRPWTLAAWTFLTAGIALGSWWAYYELGWGGWWYWDPVENASFMPWLMGTALLHSAIVVEKRDTLKAWTVLLAILAFSLSLIGTFLVRSGVLTSVHAFATDPTRGIFILAILVVAIGGSLTLFALRAPALKGVGLFAPVSREGSLIVNNLLLAVACAAVFIGTLYPLFADAVSGGTDKVSVGPPFFNATFVPIMVPLIAVMAAGPMLAWKRGDGRAALKRLIPALIAAVIVTAGAYSIAPAGAWLAPIGLGLAAWLFVGSLLSWLERAGLTARRRGHVWRRLVGLPRSAYGVAVAHAGLAIVIAGISGTAWQIERIQVMHPGESIALGPYEMTFVGATDDVGPNYQIERGEFTLSRGNRVVAIMQPEKRFYPVAQMPTTEAAIRTTLFSDVYVVLGDTDGAGGWTTRLYFNPIVPWMWLGVLIMVAGGLLSLSDRRHRIGAPALSRRRQTDPAAAPAA